jgi:hypothetical protein
VRRERKILQLIVVLMKTYAGGLGWIGFEVVVEVSVNNFPKISWLSGH